MKSSLAWVSLVLSGAGYGLLIFVDWRVALGVFLTDWAVGINVSSRG